MSRRTINLVAPNGARKRTTIGKHYYVVQYGTLTEMWDQLTQRYVTLPEPKPYAQVSRRTDSPTAARSKLREHRQACVIIVTWNGEKFTQRILTDGQLAAHVMSEKPKHPSGRART